MQSVPITGASRIPRPSRLEHLFENLGVFDFELPDDERQEEELGTSALALDGGKRRIETATTNAGHLLWSRVPTREQAERVARHFAGEDMFSARGLRTLSSRHSVYNPMSYPNGPVWPHDNVLVMLGLSLYGHGTPPLRHRCTMILPASSGWSVPLS